MARVASVKKAPAKKIVRVPKVAHEVQAYIPHPDVAIRYKGRKIWGQHDWDIAKAAMDEDDNILLMGDTGAGKTMFGEAFASSLGLMYYSLACDVSIDPSALFGRMQPTEVAGKFEYQDGPVTQIVRHGGVLNISEANFMVPKIAASLYPLLDSRRYVPLLGHKGEIVRPPAGGLLIIADMNPNYRGTMELNEAFKNRFKYKLPWAYDPTVEKELTRFPTIRTIASKLRANTQDIRTPVSTNMLMEFESLALSTLGMVFAIENFVSAFAVNEQQAIKQVFELNKTSLTSDVKFFLASNDDEDLEDIEFVQEQQ